MKKCWSNLILILFVSLLSFAGCSGDGSGNHGDPPPPPIETTGSLITVMDFGDTGSQKPSFKLGATQSDVVSASITATWGTDGIKTVDCNQTSPTSKWNCLVGNVPANIPIDLTASTKDIDGAEIHNGSSDAVVVQAGQTTNVLITMQSTNPPPPHHMPVITSLTSPASVETGTTPSIDIEVTDSDDSSVKVNFAFATNNSGGILDATKNNIDIPTATLTNFTTYTAGATAGIDTITITVTDGNELSTSKTITIEVTTPPDGTIDGTLNLPPDVIAISGVESGDQTTFTATATDTDGDVALLTFQWYFDGLLSAQTTNPITVDTPTAGTEIIIEVTDGDGASNSYTIIWGGGINPPTGLIAQGGDGEITVSWNNLVNADSYNIYWSTTTDVTHTTGDANVTSSHVHTGLTNGTKYCYVVTAVYGADESDDSNVVCATPNPIVYSENFESGMGLWSTTNGIWEIGAPTSGPGSAYSGTGVAATVLAGNYPDNNSALISPSILLPAIGVSEEIHLRFWQWFSLETNRDFGRVYIQTQNTDGTWSGWTRLSSYSGSSGPWTNPLVDLTSYAGGEIHLGFWLEQDGDGVYSGWYIDDLSITVIQAPIVVTSVDAYTEGFENGMGDWWASNGTWEIGTPASGPNSAYSGTGVAATVLAGNYFNNDSGIVSPSIQLPAIATNEELHLRFWQWFSLETNRDFGRVYIQTQNTDGTWSGWTRLSSYSGSSGPWTNPLVDLTSYAGEKIRLEFSLKQDRDGVYSGWYIDDLSVTVIQAPIVVTSVDAYTEGFENGMGDWWASNGTWEIGTPASGPNSAYSGTGVAATVLAGNYFNNNSGIVSPSIQLPAIAANEEIHLRFWQWFYLETNRDFGRVYIQTQNADGTWNGWVLLPSSYTGISGPWTNPLVDLTSYAGGKIRLEFWLEQDRDGVYAGWYIDDVSISTYTP